MGKAVRSCGQKVPKRPISPIWIHRPARALAILADVWCIAFPTLFRLRVGLQKLLSHCEPNCICAASSLVSMINMLADKENEMTCRINVGSGERWLRIAAGILMITCGINFGVRGLWIGYLIGASGAFTLLTGIIRWCPMCAVGGRKITEA